MRGVDFEAHGAGSNNTPEIREPGLDLSCPTTGWCRSITDLMQAKRSICDDIAAETRNRACISPRGGRKQRRRYDDLESELSAELAGLGMFLQQLERQSKPLPKAQAVLQN